MRRARPLAWLAAACLLAATFLGPSLGAQEPNRAGIVVRHSDGETSEMCVLFDEDEITGAQLLERSKLEVTTDTLALGTAVCAIEGEGCARDDCFCDYPTFWGYWTRDGRSDWSFSQSGASDRVVRDGSVDGWSFGKDGKPAPPDVTIGSICEGTVAMPTARSDAERAPAPDYLMFAAFAGLLAAAAGMAYVLRRRRGRP